MRLTIPTSYNQLTATQLRKVQYILLTEQHRTRAQWRILKVLLKKKWYNLRSLIRVRRSMPLDQLWSYCDYIDHGTSRTDFIPLKVKSKTYHGPIEKLFNLTAAEFSAVDSMFIAFCESATQTIKERRHYLEYMAGVLYTSSDNPIRPQFHKAAMHQLAAPFKRQRTSTLLCVLTAYAGCREHLQKKYKYVFPKSSKKATKSKKQKAAPGFDQIILNMTGDRLADLNDIKNTPLYDFLDKMNNDLDPKNKRNP